MNHKLVLRGDRPLKGSITAQGAKNAALPVMASALLMKNGTLELAGFQTSMTSRRCPTF